MTPEDAKLILRMRRSGDRDAGDPKFVEALAAVERDPVLKAWHAREQQHDRAVADKLASLPPPPGLREAILAGARLSEPKRVPFWRQPVWLAAAATVAVLLGVAATLRIDRGAAARDALALAAAAEMVADGRSHTGLVPNVAGIRARLAETRVPLHQAMGQILDLDTLRREGCRPVWIAGHEMLELCFQKDGAWFHVYLMPRQGAPLKFDADKIAALEGGRIVAAAWSDAKYSYALVSDAGKAALQRVL